MCQYMVIYLTKMILLNSLLELAQIKLHIQLQITTSANGTVGTNATFSVNGGNQTTTHTGGQSKIVGNSPQFTLVFGGVAVAAGAGTAEVTSGGDPYICPCYGPTYKLPDRNAFYRLYENNDIIINGEVKEISESRKKKLIAYNKKKGFGHLDAVIKDIYLFRSIYVSVGQHKLAFNLEKINWVTTSNSKKFFKVSKPSGVDLESEWFVGGEDGAAHMKISWMYENEPMHINLYFFNDPQKENGISLKGMTSTILWVYLLETTTQKQWKFQTSSYGIC